MVRSILTKNRFRLPGWGALLLGFGALFAGGARAGNPDLQAPGNIPHPPNARGAATDDVTVRWNDGRIYVSQAGGGAFEELALGNTPEAAHFKKLLDEAGIAAGPISVPVGSTIVASGGSGATGRKPKAPPTTGSEPNQPDTNGSGQTK
jgi:hypothetical protein